MKIYMFEYNEVFKRFEEYNDFTLSDVNEGDSLPNEVVELILLAYADFLFFVMEENNIELY